jgi:dolichyl-phosphate-mannose--protein O-mannosyl transferase
MLDCQIFGLNAGEHLLVNALIHACNTLVLFLFLRRITGARWQSAIVAALFALHPAARGVGRLGCGAEGHFVNFLRFAESAGLCSVC